MDLFFVLSGFLIGGILIDANGSKNYFQAFYLRRAFRILPLYFVVLAAVLLLNHGARQVPLGWYLTITGNVWLALNAPNGMLFGHVWSLGVEEQFYILFPLFIWLVPQTYLRPSLIALIALTVAVRCLMTLVRVDTTAIYVLLITRMDALFVGALLAVFLRDHKTSSWLATNKHRLYWLLLALAAPVALFIAKKWTILSLPMSTIGFTLFAACFGCLLLISVLDATGPVGRLMANSPLRWFGKRAYFLFLAHILIVENVFYVAGGNFAPASLRFWLILGTAITALLALAEVSWRLFKSPLIELGHRLAQYQAGHSPSGSLSALISIGDVPLLRSRIEKRPE